MYMEITPLILLNQSQNNEISAAALGRKLRYNIHILHSRNVQDAFYIPVSLEVDVTVHIVVKCLGNDLQIQHFTGFLYFFSTFIGRVTNNEKKNLLSDCLNKRKPSTVRCISPIGQAIIFTTTANESSDESVLQKEIKFWQTKWF